MQNPPSADPKQLMIENYKKMLQKLLDVINQTLEKHSELRDKKAYEEIMVLVNAFDGAIRNLERCVENENATDAQLKAAVQEASSRLMEIAPFVSTKRANPPGFMGYGERSIASSVLYKSIGEQVFSQPVMESTALLKAIAESKPKSSASSSSSTSDLATIGAREDFTAQHGQLARNIQQNITQLGRGNVVRSVQTAADIYSLAAAEHANIAPKDPRWEKSATSVDAAHKALVEAAKEAELPEGNLIQMTLNTLNRRLEPIRAKVIHDGDTPSPSINPKK